MSLAPTDFHVFAGEKVPDPITFTVGEDWCNRSNLYPRQATLLKVIFLREDLFTDYDYEVVDEWERSFKHTGNNGITPGILNRMRYLKAQGYPWFREVLLVLGRRAGKGYVAAIAMAYVLWNYLAMGDPQGHFGVDRDKKLACFIYAGKKDQATKNLWGDLNNVIKGAPCFAKYISRSLGESISVYAPNDFVRMRKQFERGIDSAADMATFLIEPKEATLMSGRGPTSFMQGYDEMAHVVATGANRSAEDIYGAATPALDQFKKYAFIIEPSSPWQQVGQFYLNWQNSLLFENGLPAYPQMMMLQLTSWEMYYDWAEAHLLPLFPDGFTGDLGEYADKPHPQLSPLKGAIQEFDEPMQRLERANPDTFKVERRSQWQATVDAYLNPDKIVQMFAPWGEDNRTHDMQTTGLLSVFYKGHADPSLANANFGLAIGHPETVDGTIHLIFDYIHHFQPSDFPDNTIDYPFLGEHVWGLLQGFKPDEFTYDQWNSAETIQRLTKKIREANFPKRVQVYEKTAPQPLDASVLTPKGWTSMGEISVGDEVIGLDGKPHAVVGVYPKGEQEVYQVTFNDGGRTECTADHIWSVRKGTRAGREIRTLQEMVDIGLRYPSGPHRWAVPKVDPVQFAPLDEALPLDPYLLGVLLGDGSLGPGGISIACSIEDVEQQMKLLSTTLPDDVVMSWKECSGKGGHRWAKISFAGSRWRHNPLLDALKALGLHGCTKDRKFVPESYLRASVDERMALMQGLMDSDGTSRAKGGSHRALFSSKNVNLMSAMVDLTGGLGGTAKIKQYGERTPDVLISGLPGMVPFRLPRKVAGYSPSRPMDHRFIVGVESVGKKQTQCISVDVPDHLYVTDDYLVTHNTAAHNWERAENFKVALNQGWIHAPYYEQAELELKFLQLKNGKVVKQDAGPVQTKDVADCLMEVAWTVLGTQVHALTHQGLSNLSLHATAAGGFDPHSREYGEDSKILNQFSTSTRGRDYNRRGGGNNPARNPLGGRAGRRR